MRPNQLAATACGVVADAILLPICCKLLGETRTSRGFSKVGQRPADRLYAIYQFILIFIKLIKDMMMLKSVGRALIRWRFGKRYCFCLRNKQIDKGLRDAVRPYDLGWFSCWCEQPDR